MSFIEDTRLKSNMDPWKFREMLLTAFGTSNNSKYFLSILKTDLMVFADSKNCERLEIRFDFKKKVGKIHKVNRAKCKDCGTIEVPLKSKAWCADWFWEAIFNPKESGGEPIDEIRFDSTQLAML